MDNPAAPISSIPLQPAVSFPVESKNRPWLLWSAIGLIFLALGIAVGLFSAKFLSQSQDASPLTSTPSPTQSPASTPTPDPTANWKTYSNSEGNYQIKYPNSWTFTTYTQVQSKGHATFKYVPIENSYLGEIRIVTAEFLRGSQWVNLSTEQFFDHNDAFWVKGLGVGGGPGTDYTTPQEISINGNRAMFQKSRYSTVYEYVGPWINTYSYYIPINSPKELVYIFFSFDDRDPQKESVLKQFDQILSTFKFLD